MNAPADDAGRVTGVLLAGGRATRMGGADKGLVTLAGRPLAQHVLDRLRPQVAAVLVNANRNADTYLGMGVAVVPDPIAGYPGPLAGLLAGMERADTELVLMVPCDSPFLPADLVSRLVRALDTSGADVAVAHDGSRRQPAFLLVRRGLQGDLRRWLEAGGRKIDAWFERHRVADADLSDCPDAFVNINTPEERDMIDRRMQGVVGDD